jgi:hypothetical protein
VDYLEAHRMPSANLTPDDEKAARMEWSCAEAIVAVPYYAGVAAVDALGSVGIWLGDKAYDLFN